VVLHIDVHSSAAPAHTLTEMNRSCFNSSMFRNHKGLGIRQSIEDVEEENHSLPVCIVSCIKYMTQVDAVILGYAAFYLFILGLHIALCLVFIEVLLSALRQNKSKTCADKSFVAFIFE
jgi:hypothetical protein